MQGILISIEGCDGVGKTTQVKLLNAALKKLDREVLITREPGGTEEADKIRKILLETTKFETVTEFLLYSASRYENNKKLIIPALMEEKIVICDRYIDSTIAYQGYGQGEDLQIIDIVNQIFLRLMKPHITLILDMGPEQCIARLKTRKKNNNHYDHYNHYDSMDITFRKKVRDGFIKISKQRRCHLIKVDNDNEQVVHNKIIKILHDQNLI